MRILLGGGLGYLGSHLAQFLSGEPGHRVRILARTVPPYFAGWREKFEILSRDVTEKSGLAGCCDGCDAVIQLAALSRDRARLDPGSALRVSAIGTRNLLEEAVASRVPRFIYFSTFHVYGRPRERRVDETTPVDPLDDYSLAHYAGELYCRTYRERNGVGAIRVRLSNGFGAPVDKNIDCWSLAVQEFCLSAFREQRIVLKSDGSQKRDFISIPEILRATRRLIEAGPAEIRHDLYNLASGNSCSIKDLAFRVKHVYERLYRQEVRVELPGPGVSRDHQASFVTDIKRIKELGFAPDPPGTMDREIEKIFRLLGEP
jgi:UDP-glucose 4-epimerase